MGCCCEKTAKFEDLTVTSTAPKRERKIRDIPFLILFVVILAGLGYVAFVGIKNGDPGRYIYGVDSWGNVCGRKQNPVITGVQNSGMDRSNHTRELNLLLSDITLLLNPAKIFSNDSGTAVICVSHCPNETLSACDNALRNNGYNVTDPAVMSRLCHMPGGMLTSHTEVLNRCVPSQLAGVGQALLGASFMAAGAMVNALDNNATSSAASNVQPSAMKYVHEIIMTVSNSWQEIVYLLAIAVGISLIVILLLQLFTRVLVISIVILGGLGSLVVCGYFWYYYLVFIGVLPKGSAELLLQDITNSANDLFSLLLINQTVSVNGTEIPNIFQLSGLHEDDYLLPFTITATVVTVILWILIIWLRKSLRLVVSLFDEASLALFSMPGMLLQPIITVAALLVTLGGFFVIAAFLLSDEVPRLDRHGLVVFAQRQETFNGRILLIFHVFGFLWLLEFISACNQIILASSVTNWFFTRGQHEKKKCACNLCPTLKPTRDLILFSLGSAAFGSLIVAIVQFIRIVLAYIQRKLKKSDNKTAKFFLRCLSLCLACFEKVLKYINRNAYICIAMYGESFCSSAKKALALLVTNIQHVTALNCITGFCLLLGKLCVAGITTVTGVVWFQYKGMSASHHLVPVVLSCIGAYFIASCFMSVFAMSIDTIFLCFCDDQQRNNGDDRPYYSSVRLQKFMSSTNKKFRKASKATAQPVTSAGNKLPKYEPPEIRRIKDAELRRKVEEKRKRVQGMLAAAEGRPRGKRITVRPYNTAKVRPAVPVKYNTYA